MAAATSKPTGRRGPIPKAPSRDPWVPPEWDPEDAHAVQAFMQGRASPEQQQRAAAFIVHQLCGTYDQSFRPGGDRDTCFAEGKRFVGLQLVKFVNLNIARLLNKNSEQGAPPKEQ
ncbi:MAG TPA: hypothetical protein VGG49_13405 [Steroidobacteraceae bacterium]|jgi:hypothetical protein